MKHIRLARLALALTPLSLSLAALPAPAAAQASPGAGANGLPPGTPPLTVAQQQKQAARIARFRTDVGALQANTSLTPAQKQQQFAEMQTAVDKDMLAILTPAQQQAVVKQRNTVLSLKKQFAQQHKAEIAQETQINLQLQKSITPQQKQKMALIQQQAQAQAKKMIADPKATSDVKRKTVQAIGRDAVRQQMAVMTPVQRSQVNQLQTISAHITQELAAFAKANGQQ